MKKIEATELLVEMQQRWPNKRLVAETVEFYRTALQKLDFATTRAAVTRLYESRGSFPQPADLKREMGIAVEKPKAAEPVKLSPRGEEIAQLLCEVSNVTFPRALRRDLAEKLSWELGVGQDTESAWYFAVECRIALGWSKQSREAWHQIAAGFKPNGIAPSRRDWLRIAGMLADDGSENLPEAKLSAHGVRERIARLVDAFCRAHGAPVPTRHEVADERLPYADPDVDDEERLRRYPPWLRDRREVHP